jgi:hypothetical protein
MIAGKRLYLFKFCYVLSSSSVSGLLDSSVLAIYTKIVSEADTESFITGERGGY